MTNEFHVVEGIHASVYVVPVSDGNRFKNYSYLVVDPATREAVLIDPAWEIDTIESALAQAEATLSHVLLTHSHHDHTNLASYFGRQATGSVWIAEDEWRYHDCPVDDVAFLDVDRPVRFGANSAVQPLWTPGHTRASVCYLVDGFAFTGDTLFGLGCGDCSGAGGDPYAMFDSLQKLKQRVEAATRVFPGHSYGMNPGQRFDEVIRGNIYVQIEDIETFMRFRMRKNQPRRGTTHPSL